MRYRQQIKTGALVTVYGANGAITHWTVTELQIIAKSALLESLYTDKVPVRMTVGS